MKTLRLPFLLITSSILNKLDDISVFYLTTFTVQTISFYHKINKTNKQDIAVLFLPQPEFLLDAQLLLGRNGPT